MNKKVLLMILDGWGISPNPKISANDNANTPFIDSLSNTTSKNVLHTYGNHVGLPKGQMGNSEVGHLNLGAGRIVYQDLQKINKDIKSGDFNKNKILTDALNYAKKFNKNVHLIGLVSNGGVHSHFNHLKAIIKKVNSSQIPNCFIHAFTDGRDVDPKSGINFLNELNDYCENTNAIIASVIGRYYAMDRDNRWDRTKKAYRLLVEGLGNNSKNLNKTIVESYSKGITDEFIEPVTLGNAEEVEKSRITENDVVIFFNFRTDRGRQLTYALTQKKIDDYGMTPLSLHFLTMTNYDDSFKNLNIIYKKENLKDTLGEILSKNGKKQLRIAETEKYPHVTFFFNGGREEPFKNEDRILCPSPKVSTYDLMPEMSAYNITEKLIPIIIEKKYDFICLNFANPDMVGHTGNMNAAVKACEVVDECAKNIVNAAIKNFYSILIISDHGNCEKMINSDGSPNTSHTTNLVPIYLIDNKFKKIDEGNLSNIAPTILKILKINQPSTMNAKSLI